MGWTRVLVCFRSGLRCFPHGLRCSGPLRRLASEIQLINTRKLKDHLPLGLEFDYVQLAGQPAPGEREAWNADALMEGVRVGHGTS